MSELPVFVSVAEAADLLDGDGVRVLEIHYDRDGTGAAVPPEHLPGAVAVELSTELARTDAPRLAGNRPLPRLADLRLAARRWGVHDDSTVIVYDDRGGLIAARAWWVLRWAGLARVAILDGGLPAWTAAGRPAGALAQDVPEGTVTLSGGRLPELDADQAAALASRGLLIDARAEDAYRAGHIPHARNVSSKDALGPGGTLRSPEELRSYYGLTSDGPVPGLSCGGGVAAAFGVAVLAHLGVTAPLYVGSFSAWKADPGRAVETGTEGSTVEVQR